MVLTVYLTGDAAQFFLFSETVSGGIEDWASRLQKIKNALQELELGKPAEKSKTPEKDQINFTDPDSRIMDTKNQGLIQDNLQIAVDSDYKRIVGIKTSNCFNDQRQFEGVLESIQQ